MPTTVERSASAEIIGYSYKLFLSRFPVLPFKWKRALYKSYADSLSDKAFDIYGRQVVESLCFTKGNSQQFGNTKQELSDVLEWMPKLDKFRGVLQEQIRKHRQKYRLKSRR